jgi:GH15 family glucan-1,4-alpha-glucosidase
VARIEEYALLGDTQTAALVSRDGSIDWLCLPRFDSPACFAALLGTPEHGRWQLAPAAPVRSIARRYRPGTLVLETEYTTDSGRVRVVDCMPPRQRTPDLVRVVEGLEGAVPMRMELVLRFDYGSIVPWVYRDERGLHAVAGPDAVLLRSSVDTHGEGLKTAADFVVHPGHQAAFVLTWYASHEPAPDAVDAIEAVGCTTAWWREWSAGGTYDGPYKDAIRDSLVVLKALTYGPTGGITAAATTSLPERIGGIRNWDYRYCWLRDATFTLYALLISGHTGEALGWRDWLVRAIAGDPSRIQTIYGVGGERRLPESFLDWLPGYEHSHPVRIGNAAVTQLQIDIYGEVMDVMHQARRAGIPAHAQSWEVQKLLLEYLERIWREPDEGLWEVRGPRQHFTHSKMMAWVAFDRAVKAVERFGLDGPGDHWRAVRDRIHADVCEHGFDRARGSFVQAYGSQALDASLLMLPLVGFLPATDPRVIATVGAIERELMHDGFVKRYRTHQVEDGLPPGEGTFLACSFWLADNYVLTGRRGDAERLFDRLLSVRNDLGLLAEEYDPVAGRLLGNFPQAFSHVGLINTAFNLSSIDRAPAADRANRVEAAPRAAS